MGPPAVWAVTIPAWKMHSTQNGLYSFVGTLGGLIMHAVRFFRIGRASMARGEGERCITLWLADPRGPSGYARAGPGDQASTPYVRGNCMYVPYVRAVPGRILRPPTMDDEMVVSKFSSEQQSTPSSVPLLTAGLHCAPFPPSGSGGGLPCGAFSAARYWGTRGPQGRKWSLRSSDRVWWLVLWRPAVPAGIMHRRCEACPELAGGRGRRADDLIGGDWLCARVMSCGRSHRGRPRPRDHGL